MTFRTAEPALKDVLDAIAKGEMQLPDFQRGWVWDDDHIRSLIASLSLSYPIGAVMFLEAGGVPFKPRLFEGVGIVPAPAPKTLVLDGQQRLTSILLDHTEHLVHDRSEQDVLYELLLKLGLDLAVPIETRQIAGKAVHNIGAGALL